MSPHDQSLHEPNRKTKAEKKKEKHDEAMKHDPKNHHVADEKKKGGKGGKGSKAVSPTNGVGVVHVKA